MFGAEDRAMATSARAASRRQRERWQELSALRAQQRGPAQALCEQRRRQLPTDPGSFCAALLGSLAYTLPAEVDAATWRVALRHFAQHRPTEGEFRRLLERRVQTGRGSGPDAGAYVAAFLLREWGRYGLVWLLSSGSAGRRRHWRGVARRGAAVARLPPAVQLALRGGGAVIGP